MNKIIIMDKGSEARKLVEELVYENIELMTENIRLTDEIERLKERVKDIEGFYRVFGLSCLMKDSYDKLVVLAEGLRRYKN